MNILNFLVLFFCIFFIGCSPKLNEKNYFKQAQDLKPILVDDSDYLNSYQIPDHIKIQWEGEIPTSEALNAISDLIELGERRNSVTLKKSALRIYKKLYATDISIKSDFTDTPYMTFFNELAIPEVKKALKDLSLSLDENLEIILKFLMELKAQKQWPSKATFLLSIDLIDSFLESIIVQVKLLRLEPRVEASLVDELRSEKKENIEKLKQYWNLIQKESTLKNILTVVDSLLKDFEINLDKSLQQKIEEGQALSAEIENIKDELSGLNALVTVWFFLSEKEREEYFKPISKALYEYLSSRTDKELTCLTKDECPSWWESLKRDWGVLPEIKKFGIEELKDTLNKRAHSYALKILEENLLVSVKNLDSRIVKKVKLNIANGKNQVEKLRKNAQSLINEKVRAWARNQFDDKTALLNSFETDKVLVSTRDKTIKFFIDKKKKDLKIKSDVIGSSFRLSNLLWKNNLLTKGEYLKNVIEQINKLMALGGLPGSKGPSIGLISPLEANSKEKYDLTKSIFSRTMFGLTDDIQLTAAYLPDLKKPRMISYSVSNQLNTISGLLSLMTHLRDWEYNSYDQTIGKLNSSDIFKTDAIDGENITLFPKARFFGLTVAELINLLANFNKNNSSIALITSENEKVWINDYLKNKDKNILYGAVVDIINGNRSSEVSMKSMHELVLLLKNLITNIPGIKNTKSPELLKKADSCGAEDDRIEKECKSYAELINDNIFELKKIFIPVGNLISSKFRRQIEDNSVGAVCTKVSILNLEQINVEYSLADQFRAVEALVIVYENTGIETYLWAAKETFNYLQRFYNPQTDFFEYNSARPDLPTLLLMLRSFDGISKYFDVKERITLKEKFKVWEYAMSRIN